MVTSYRSHTCCGLYEVGTFETVKWNKEGTGTEDISVEELVKRIETSLGARQNYVNFCTINDTQFKYKNLVEALEICGFEEQIQWLNPNSSHQVKFFLRKPGNHKKTKKVV